jgi:WD40 repeat protein
LIAEHRPRPEGFPKELFDDDMPRRRRGFNDKIFHLTTGFCFSADGSRFLMHFNKLRVYDTAGGKEVQTFEEELDTGYYRPQISRDDEWLIMGSGGDRGTTVVNLRLGKRFGHVELGAGTRGGAFAIAPDGRSFALETSDREERRIRLYETMTLQPRLAIPLEYGYVYRMAYSPDGRFLAVALIDGSVVIWDVRSLEI